MSRIKHMIIALGLLLVLGGGGTAMAAGHLGEVAPMVVAREAEAVTRVVRIWMKRPVPGLEPADAPTACVVAYVAHH